MSEDPTQVDSLTLLASVRSDIGKARGKITEAWRFLDFAMVALWELEEREKKRNPPP